MNAADADAMYALLPAFVRLRDQTVGGGALRALIGVIAEQAEVVGNSIDQLYDDQFIETCALWAVPYIGDLVSFSPLRPLGPGQPTATRAEVANTIGYRRRKGTLAMLEQLCSDVTGWPGVAVEYFGRMATTQYVRNHARPANAMVDVRSPMVAADMGGAFDLVPHTADVRRIDSGRGRYNLPDVGLFVWRLKAYRRVEAPARLVGTNRYTLDPFGGDVPLVNPAAPAKPAFELFSQPGLPFFLQRYPLYAGIEPYAAPDPVRVSVGGVPVAGTAIGWCDLTSWTAPTQPGVDVAIDPELGRLVFATAPDPGVAVTATFDHAFSGDYGGGAYPQPVPDDEQTLEAQAVVATVPSFAAADLSTARHGIFEVEDSGIHPGDLTLTPDSGRLVLRAAELQRPVLAGGLTVTGVAGASVTLRGLGIGGPITVVGAGPLTLRLEHCTVRGGVDWSASGLAGTLVLDHTLSAALAVNPQVAVDIVDSAVDAGSDTTAAVVAAGASVTLSRSTVVGTVEARTVPLLENSIVTGTVVSAERQAGCLRYSFVPTAGSSTPRRFRCQPDLAVAALAESDPDAAAAVDAWLLPSFTSRVPGAPGYLQLTDATPAEIRSGGEDGDEMGVFFGLFSGRRESNLAYRVNEYLRIGLQAGIIHAT